jgi:hypothetical protein
VRRRQIAGEAEDGPYVVRVENEWLVCDDTDDPGGREIWSGIFTEDEPRSYGTAAEAGEAARNVAYELLHDAGSLAWDGTPP